MCFLVHPIYYTWEKIVQLIFFQDIFLGFFFRATESEWCDIFSSPYFLLCFIIANYYQKKNKELVSAASIQERFYWLIDFQLLECAMRLHFWKPVAFKKGFCIIFPLFFFVKSIFFLHFYTHHNTFWKLCLKDGNLFFPLFLFLSFCLFFLFF